MQGCVAKVFSLKGAVMEWITDVNVWISLATLTALEIILGIDSIVRAQFPSDGWGHTDRRGA